MNNVNRHVDSSLPTVSVDPKKLGYIGKQPLSKARDPDSWYTPPRYTDLAKQVMGSIDLDPFSSSFANQSVQAIRYFDAKKNAFKQEWFVTPGTVFMNPPYSRHLIQKSTGIFLENWLNGRISQGIVLVNNATETIWFQNLLKNASAICLASKRISFTSVDGKNVSGNTRGQVFLYFGDHVDTFKNHFEAIGVILRV